MKHSKVSIIGIDDIAQRLTTLTRYNKVAVLADEHTFEFCYPLISNDDVDVLLIPCGEEAKQLEVVQFLWSSLLELKYTRQDYLITLGGGSASDVGAFVASTYMRGLQLMHIPTTLLGMIDASIGGKTAIDFGSVKNTIGTFYEAEEIWVSLDFLKTLPDIELKSGLGELIKYGLLISDDLFLSTLGIEVLKPDTIAQVIQYKLDIVTEDLTDRSGHRMQLNLGHTTAHSLEALAIDKGQPLSHGIAVVAGLVVALYISHKWFGLNERVLTTLARDAKRSFPKVVFSCQEYDQLWHFAIKDKKNTSEGELTMVLLKEVGTPLIRQVHKVQWLEALDFYRDYMY